MESENSSIDIQCEHLMNIVVESRKRYGKMCAAYEKKISMMENKLLNLQIETFSNYKFKPKNPLPAMVNDDAKEFENFSMELMEMSQRFADIQKKVKSTQEVVNQLKTDRVGQRLRGPLDAGVILARVKGNLKEL